jgi:hypothetical protein
VLDVPGADRPRGGRAGADRAFFVTKVRGGR